MGGDSLLASDHRCFCSAVGSWNSLSAVPTLLPQTHAMSVLPLHLDRIAIQDPKDKRRKNVEFRRYGKYHGGTVEETNQLFLYESGDQHKDPIIVDVIGVELMTVRAALIAFPKDAHQCRLSSMYALDRKVHCILLGVERTRAQGTITLLYPMNVMSVPQFNKKSGHPNFCKREDVGKFVENRVDGSMQCLIPLGFAKLLKN
jgi:hypothetical protein